MRSSTRTSRAAATRTLAALTLAAQLSLCALPASGQVSLFKDEEAREKLAEIEGKVELVQGNLRRLAAEAAELNNEKQELLRLIRQLSGLVEEANLIANRHDARIDEIGGYIETEGEALGRRIDEGFDRVAGAMVSNDAKLYDRGVRSHHDLDYDAAERDLRELLLRYPASRFAHAATYRLGLLLHERGSLAESQETLTGLLASHPDSPRVPDALLLLAQMASERGDEAVADGLRRRLLDNHPASSAADRLRSEAPAGT